MLLANSRLGKYGTITDARTLNLNQNCENSSLFYENITYTITLTYLCTIL